jgi:hypothetical protein
MFSVDISYDQPWFDPVYLLQREEEKAFRAYFATLEANVSQLMRDEPAMRETELTTGLVLSLKGWDSVAKRRLDKRLEGSALDVRISAQELHGKPAASGELLDFVIEFTISTPGTVWLHGVLLAEGKRLYLDGDAFTPGSRFKELNHPETKAGQRRVRSAVQAKTMMEVHCRAGAFFLYCPQKVDGSRVGIRVLVPETVCMFPRQPTLRQVYGDTHTLPDFMLEHFFTGRRGIDPGVENIRGILGGETRGSVAARYHWRLEITLPDGRRPQLDRMGPLTA